MTSSIWKTEGLDGFPLSDVLNCRGVCKHWNAVIDKLIIEKFQHFEEDSQDNDDVAGVIKSFSSKINLSFCLDDDTDTGTKKLHNFLSHFEHTHPGGSPPSKRNPFIWGNIYVDTGHSEQDGDYYEFLRDVTTFLSKYGHHIHTFSLHCDGDEFKEAGNGSMFEKWFSYVPNLKELTFKAVISKWWEDDENTLITGWTFPKYHLLEKLTTEDLPPTLINPLIRENNHVPTLFVESVMDGYDFFTVENPKLKHLKMGYVFDVHLEMMRRLPGVQWALESLGLEFTDDSGVGDLFRIVQDKFGSTLVNLEIKMDHNNVEKGEGPHWLDFKNFRLRLPKLKQITLKMFRNRLCLDFLLGMKQNLEEISVQVNYLQPVRQNVTLTSGTVVQFMGFEGKMLESNVWVLFKKLKKIEVEVFKVGRWESRVYFRDEWELNNEYI